MRKFVAILGLCILLFQLAGYHLMIDYFQNRQAKDLQAKLDLDRYDEQDLVLVKIPVNLPYYNNSPIFEKIVGSVEVNGIEYRYVKRRIVDGFMELACLPNIERKTFENARSEVLRMSQDLAGNRHGKKVNFVKNIFAEYFHKPETSTLEAPIVSITPAISYYKAYPLAGMTPRYLQPPKGC